MDIEQMKRLLESRIESGKKLKEVRDAFKTHKAELQDMSIESSKLFKPITKKMDLITPEKIKKTTDKSS